ncbi:cation diffusion facilitator family transporter [Terribacillus saccharophilus]|uniref:cation diffusion facilitator family transporter n=1 Tax=Terribacillus saccharophilus TaxID=361277 RepID=UPI003808944A
MGNGHDHNHGANKKALLFSFIITTVYMISEAVGGFVTNSLALLSDAGHMLSDAISLGIGVLAFSIGEKTANYSKTYGYKRFEILAAAFNGISLLVVAIYIFYEAFGRFRNPPEVASGGMLIIAAIGLVVNIFVAWLLMRGDTKENLNLRAAFLHVLGDLLGSIGAIVASLLIIFFNLGIADPLASVIVAVLVLISGWRVTKDAVHVLMEGTPQNLNVDKIVNIITNRPQIISVHDLHLWAITSGQNALSCHAVVSSDLTLKEIQNILDELERALSKEGIDHITIQVENPHNSHKESLLCNSLNE